VEETNAQSNLEEELEGSGNAVTDDVESESDGDDGEKPVGEQPEEESPEEESKSKQIEIDAGDDDEEGIEGVEEGIKKGIEEGANDDEKSGDGVWSDDDDDATAAQEASDEDDEVAKVAGEDATEEVEEEVGATGEVTTGALLEGALDDILLSEVAPAADGDAEGATEDAAGVVAGNVAGDVNVDERERERRLWGRRSRLGLRQRPTAIKKGGIGDHRRQRERSLDGVCKRGTGAKGWGYRC
jgi:hypothetical protein